MAEADILNKEEATTMARYLVEMIDMESEKHGGKVGYEFGHDGDTPVIRISASIPYKPVAEPNRYPLYDKG